MNKLIFGNLVHRPLRSLISALAVAIEVVMILSIVSVMYGFLNGTRDQQSGTGYDMLVRPSKGSAILATSSASASVKAADVLRTLPHVQVVSPASIKILIEGAPQNLMGIDYPSYNALKAFQFKAGTPFQGAYDMIIDDIQAANKHLKVGDVVHEIGHDFRICGVVLSGKGARLYIPLTTLDALDGNPGKAALFYVRSEDAPKYQEDVKKEVLATPGMSDWSAETLDELLSQLTAAHVPAFNLAVRIVIGIATVIGFLVIFQSMYTAVMERTREIGILKSMGASRGAIVNVVLRETVLLAAAGTVLGIIITFLLKLLLKVHSPAQPFALTGGWIVVAILITLAGALLGALYPALKAARKDPIDALAYE